MSYTIYTTPAIVLRIIPSGEASCDVVFFTRNLGKITARAQSAREMRSTMRMHLVRFHHVTIDVVRGKNIWRLTGITSEKNNYTPSAGLLRALQTLDHLVVGQQPDGDLFDHIIELFYQDALFGIQKKYEQAFEIFSLITILMKLGYWQVQDTYQCTADDLEKIATQKKKLIGLINHAFQQTQIMVQ